MCRRSRGLYADVTRTMLTPEHAATGRSSIFSSSVWQWRPSFPGPSNVLAGGSRELVYCGIEKKAAVESGGELFNVGNQPIKRIGRPEDIAKAALFFASDASEHQTGQLVSVSGGSFMF